MIISLFSVRLEVQSMSCHPFLLQFPTTENCVVEHALIEIRERVKNRGFGTTFHRNRVTNRVFHGNFSDFPCGILAGRPNVATGYILSLHPISDHSEEKFSSPATFLSPVTDHSSTTKCVISSLRPIMDWQNMVTGLDRKNVKYLP